jgi:uncharacterized protein with HEPN domain
MNERGESLLLSIKEECEYLLEKGKRHDSDDILYDKDLQHIVTMALINIGEYVKSLSIELKEENRYIKWSEIVGLRNKAVHNYDSLHMDRIWGNVTRDLPELLEQVERILLAEGVEE